LNGYFAFQKVSIKGLTRILKTLSLFFFLFPFGFCSKLPFCTFLPLFKFQKGKGTAIGTPFAVTFTKIYQNFIFMFENLENLFDPTNFL